MIINNILFIHCPKSGGTSLQKLLFKTNDINIINYGIMLVSDFFKKECNEGQFLGNLVISDYNHAGIIPLSRLNINSPSDCIVKLFYMVNGKQLTTYFFDHLYHEHWSLSQYSKTIDINNYKIIFICRNPIDRIISTYFFLNFHRSIEFDDFVLKLIKFKNNLEKNNLILSSVFTFFAVTQKSYITVNGIVPKNIDIIHLENKKEIDLLINKKYNLGNLLHTNKTQNKQKIKLSDSIISLIKREYKEDFEYFSYN